MIVDRGLKTARAIILGVALAAGAHPFDAGARDAAFADPMGLAAARGGTTTNVTDSVTVEPKPDIDTGESIINEPKRTTLFFSNKTSAPVDIVGIATNDDLNVKSSIVTNDCSREGRIAPSSRCMVVVETTPTNSGPWTAEVLMTHKGAGRIARAKLTGKSVGQSSADKKESGFSISTKDVKPIDFGDVEVGSAKVARTALMVNDSTENIVLVSIDVIAAGKGLDRLEQGCLIDMELKPGESCPVTMVWQPQSKEIVSTDLIIRHTGKLGFAVIPVRGIAREAKEAEGGAKQVSKSEGTKEPPALTPRAASAAEELEKALADRIPALAVDTLPREGVKPKPSTQASPGGEFQLIGTVGNRAVLLKPDGATIVASIGEEIDCGDGAKAKVTNVTPKGAEIFVDNKKKQLTLSAARALTSKASSSNLGSGEPKPPSGSSSKAASRKSSASGFAGM